MPDIDDLLTRIPEAEVRDGIKAAFDKLANRKKFGLVFEEHRPECTPLYGVKIRAGLTVALRPQGRNGGIGEIYNVVTISRKEAEAIAYCVKEKDEQATPFPLKDLVAVARFGDPIYPALTPIATVENAPGSDLWHTLIEADNYHALQLLAYAYEGKVDCIYIDPPYNTGARDWKYNNDYVDANDSYRHSKWLSMMKKRLLLAKKLLNPKDSVLIVTIDEKEYLHLGCLLEEMFKDANIQMVSSVISQSGVARASSFYRTNEFIYIIQLGNSTVTPLPLPDEWVLGNNESAAAQGIVWAQLRRSGTNSLRQDRPNLFYPIIFNQDGRKIVGTGNPLDVDSHPLKELEEKNNQLYLWPMKPSGVEGNWQLSSRELMQRLSKGYVKIGKMKANTIPVSYLYNASIEKIESGQVKVLGRDPKTGQILVDSSAYVHAFVPGTQWNISSHDAKYQGSQILNKIFEAKRFDFPKSLYAVHDCLRFFVANKPNALILDFFAGSGTTLHAVNLLNAEDGGKRRCIMVTNNEVSAEEEKAFKERGLTPASPEWAEQGIARSVTWPRTVCSIEGHNINGEPLRGEYLTTATKEVAKRRIFKQIPFPMQGTAERKVFASLVGIPQNLVTDAGFLVAEDKEVSIWFGPSGGDLFDTTCVEDWLEALEAATKIKTVYICTAERNRYNQLKAQAEEVLGEYTVTEPIKLPMAEGFKANAAFFKLDFLDKDAVGRGFFKLLPLLWLKAGGFGKCPEQAGDAPPPRLVLPENRFAVLVDAACSRNFEEEVNRYSANITTAYIVTDSDDFYSWLAGRLRVKNVVQLYSDYLNNFAINLKDKDRRQL